MVSSLGASSPSGCLSCDSAHTKGVTIARIAVAVVLLVLGLGHVLFALTNFGFVEELPEDLNIAAEGVGAAVAGAALGWAGMDRARGGRPWRVVMLAGTFFVATMIVSIATGASAPQMILVALFAPALGATASAVDNAST